MSPNKLIVPYLHRVCRHLLWPPYRARVRRELTDHVRKIIAEKNVLLQLYPDYFATAQQEMKL